MKRFLPFTLLLGCGLLAFRALPVQQEIKFTLPPGFAVQSVYPADKAGTVVAITFDSQGRLVIARENGQVVTLFDNNQDGTIDEERAFTEEVTTSQGIFFDGPHLLVTGRGPEGVGLYRVHDDNGDSRGERVELIELAVGNIQEHGPHQPYFGPDGYLYWTHGNGAGLFSRFAPLSPLREYDEASMLGRVDPRGHASQWRAPGGTFVRRRLDEPAAAGAAGAPARRMGPGAQSRDWELVAAGFRNMYDGAFNMMGELFTFDSDMEWDRDLPWYKGTSSVHVVPGGDHAWRSGSMNHPWHYLDNLPPMEDLGRGSPTGVAFYQSYNYPRDYWDSFLQADWSRGRIVIGKLTRDGATYDQESSNFVYGEPLNVTDVDVGPDGNAYFSLGGRNTQGGIYRVVYTGSDAMGRPQAGTPIDQVLTMAQPRAAFSRQQAREVKAQMGDAAWQQALTAEVRNAQASPDRRVRAMELLQVFGPGLDENVLVPLRSDPSWEVRAASTYYLGMKNGPAARRELVARLKDSDPFVQRRAAEALLRTGVNPTIDPPFSPAEDVLPLLSSPDRFVRYAARSLLRQTNPNLWQEEALRVEGYPQAPEALMAVVETFEDPRITDVTRLLGREIELLRATPSEPELLQLIRVVQRTMLEDHGVTNHNVGALRPPPPPPPGSQQAGQGGRGQQQNNNAYAQIGQLLLERFPAADTSLSREIARTLAYLETPGAVEKISAELENSGNLRTQQIFYADMLSYMDEGWDDASVERLAGWLERVYREDWRGGASFTGFVNYIRDGFLANVPPERHAALARRMEAAQPQLATLTPGARFQASISPEEAEDELIYNPNVLQGNPAAGVAAYEKAQCIACHTFGPIGREFGPDLTTVNQRFSRADLVRAVTRPSETVSDLWQVEEITRTDGRKVSGTIYREDANELIVQIPGGGQVTIPKSQVRTRTRMEKSPMPEGLLGLLDGAERRNLFLLLQAGPSAIPDSALTRLNASR